MKTSLIPRTAEQITEVARPFLAAMLPPSSYVEIVAIYEREQFPKDRPKTLHRIWTLDKIDYEWIAKMNAKGYGIHYGVNPRASNKGSGADGSCTAEDVEEFHTVFFDADGITDLDAADIFILEKIQALSLPPPTASVKSSGTGGHRYWRVDMPIKPAKWVAIQDALAEFFKPDLFDPNPPFNTDPKTHELHRTMRLPGTYNQKPGKADRDRLVEVIDASYESSVPYFIFDALKHEAKKRLKDTKRLPEDVEAYIRSREPLPKHQKKRSAAVIRAASVMKWCGHSDDTTRAVLRRCAERDDMYADGKNVDELIKLGLSLSHVPRDRFIDHEIDDPDAITWNRRQTRKVAADAIRGLNEFNDKRQLLYAMKGALVHLCENRDGIKFSEVREKELQHYMGRANSWFRSTRAGMEPTSVPHFVAADILVNPKGIVAPPVVQIVETPRLRPDGTILTQPGYDPATQLYLDLPRGFTMPPVPEQPTPEDVAEAKRLNLNMLLADFPWVDKCDKANAVALLLTIFARPAIAGCVPAAAIVAPQAGTGKGLLTTSIMHIGTGRQSSIAWRDGTDEQRKDQFDALRSGKSIISIDNIPTGKTIKSPVYEQALTALEVEDRVLGHNDGSKVRVAPQRAVWIFNGNNIKFGSEMARRVFHVRMDAEDDHPERRTGFVVPDLEGWVRRERARLVWAALVLLRAWYVAGCPKAPLRPTIGSFQEWADMLADVLAFHGIEGFYDKADEISDEQDEERLEWEAFLFHLYSKLTKQVVASKHPPTVPFTVRQLIDTVIRKDTSTPLPRELVGSKYDDLSNPLGQMFKAKNKCVTPCGLVLKNTGLDRNKVTRWVISVLPKKESVFSIYMEAAKQSL